MNFKKMMKWGQEGFTLVELIVVIAILGILGGVAVPAYSGYVEKANKGADKALVSEVKHALVLQYYANPDEATTCHVILTTSGARTDNDVAAVAMEACFGEHWKETAVLKHDNWPAGASQAVAEAYQASSFNGKEESLLNQIGTLTNQLAVMLEDGMGGSGFDKFISDNNLAGESALTKANAAVLYAASVAGKADDNKVAATFDKFYKAKAGSDSESEEAMLNLLTGLRDENANGLGNFGACVSIYAQAEAFCQYIASESGDPKLLNDFHNKTANLSSNSSDEALTQVAEAMNFVVEQAMTEYKTLASDYVIGDGTNPTRAEKDTKAFLSAMDAITDNEDYLLGRVGLENCYTDGTVAGLLNDYMYAAGVGAAEGEVVVTLNANGSVNVFPTQIEME